MDATKQPFGWMAYYSDYSSVVVFDNELEALRYAVENSMRCEPMFNGGSVWTCNR